MDLTSMETSKTSFDKGSEGEKRVAEGLAFLGYNVIYIGGATKYSIDGGKFFSGDLFVFGKGKSFLVQVKNKEPRNIYPDTGLERWRFDNLKWLQNESGLKILIVFTDSSKKLYGEWIDNLKIELHGGEYNSKTNETMIYFWLTELKILPDLLNI